jgi:hypothetical protein
MVRGSLAIGSRKAHTFLAATLAAAISLASTAVLSATERPEAPALADLELSATTIPPPVLRTAPELSFRVAKTYKYERPKTPRAQVRRSAPRIRPKTPRAQPVAPTIRRPPTIRKGRTIRRGRSRRAPRRARSGRASGGSCGGCRNSCYVRYRVRSNSRQFVPCMRRCWKQLCR